MMLRHSTLVALALPFVSVAIAAETAASVLWMDADEIKTLLGGKELRGEYANGRAFTERYLPSGRIEYTERSTSLGGHWSIKQGTLCTIYDDDPAGGCYRVVRTGENCFEFYFASRTEAAAPGRDGEKPKWTARGSISGQRSGCQSGADV